MQRRYCGSFETKDDLFTSETDEFTNRRIIFGWKFTYQLLLLPWVVVLTVVIRNNLDLFPLLESD